MRHVFLVSLCDEVAPALAQAPLEAGFHSLASGIFSEVFSTCVLEFANYTMVMSELLLWLKFSTRRCKTLRSGDHQTHRNASFVGL